MNRRLLGFALVFALVCAAVSAADGRWTIVRGQTMTVVGDQPAETLRDIASRPERFRLRLTRLSANIGRAQAGPPVVFVFRTRKAVQPILPLAKKRRPAPLGGVFSRAARGHYI